ncbi:hypothetical protein BDK51DRAFT_36728 [Blyttiomyces helicus]|uniref:Uncharacterized protein n=1 Tax=Blyttiomyces helicus TaxID=388810 RepID=A0A4P9WEY9_9FUNG|nr:hypothetical protein BDK51DRAFT_36728 [Blyttiomyces helicus]|eukprot:RKO91184.1 hypothetical protein BDK51DRAFT_36728 [Blyttiomyces helicus]
MTVFSECVQRAAGQSQGVLQYAVHAWLGGINTGHVSPAASKSSGLPPPFHSSPNSTWQRSPKYLALALVPTRTPKPSTAAALLEEAKEKNEGVAAGRGRCRCSIVSEQSDDQERSLPTSNCCRRSRRQLWWLNLRWTVPPVTSHAQHSAAFLEAVAISAITLAARNTIRLLIDERFTSNIATDLWGAGGGSGMTEAHRFQTPRDH